MHMMIETVHTDDFSMDYVHFGSGQTTLVILPGLSVQSVMGAADAVEAVYRSLENDFTIYLFDRRKDLPPSYSVHEMAQDTAEAFRVLGLKDVCLFGASQGGMIAQVIAIEHPELVGKLVLGSSSSHVREEQYRVIEHWIRLAKKRDRVGLYLSFGKELYPAAVYGQYRETLEKTAETVSDEELDRFIILAEGIRGFNVTDELDKIRCPVMAVGDYDDRVLDADATMEIAEKLDTQPNFRLYLYAGFGHAAYDTAPDYRDRMVRFFQDA